MEEQIQKTLMMLAERKQGRSVYGWWRSESLMGATKVIIKCLICEKQIRAYRNVIEAHGMKHIKEYNLLAFI